MWPHRRAGRRHHRARPRGFVPRQGVRPSGVASSLLRSPLLGHAGGTGVMRRPVDSRRGALLCRVQARPTPDHWCRWGPRPMLRALLDAVVQAQEAAMGGLGMRRRGLAMWQRSLEMRQPNPICATSPSLSPHSHTDTSTHPSQHPSPLFSPFAASTSITGCNRCMA